MNDVRILKALILPYGQTSTNGAKVHIDSNIDFANRLDVVGFHGGEPFGSGKFFRLDDQGYWVVFSVPRSHKGLYFTKAHHMGVSAGFSDLRYTWGSVIETGRVDEIVVGDKSDMKFQTAVFDADKRETEFFYSRQPATKTAACNPLTARGITENRSTNIIRVKGVNVDLNSLQYLRTVRYWYKRGTNPTIVNQDVENFCQLSDSDIAHL